MLVCDLPGNWRQKVGSCACGCNCELEFRYLVLSVSLDLLRSLACSSFFCSPTAGIRVAAAISLNFCLKTLILVWDLLCGIFFLCSFKYQEHRRFGRDEERTHSSCHLLSVFNFALFSFQRINHSSGEFKKRVVRAPQCEFSFHLYFGAAGCQLKTWIRGGSLYSACTLWRLQLFLRSRMLLLR